MSKIKPSWRIKYVLYCVGYIVLLAGISVACLIVALFAITIIPLWLPIVIYYLNKRRKNGERKRTFKL